MNHLGTLISALADGQLAPDVAERALGHVARCPDCAAELAASRASRRVLSTAFDVPVAPGLTSRLLALGAASECWAPAAPRPPVRPGDDRLASSSVPLPGTEVGRRLPAGCLDGRLGRRRVSSRWLVVTTTGIGVMAAGLFVLGELPDVGPSVHTANALTLLGRAAAVSTAPARSAGVPAGPDAAGFAMIRTTALRQDDGTSPADGAGPADTSAPTTAMAEPGLDLSGPEAHAQVLTWIDEHGWTPPVALPDGYQVVGLRVATDGSGTLELDLDGERGLIVVTQAHGRLAPAVVARATQVEIGDAQVHVLSTSPWHGVWQAGDTVVSVVAEVPSDIIGSVVTAYPAQAYDDGITARMLRGWDVLAGTWSP
ncbi:anti-sigma factor [Cellulomonas sp. KRMCY2]|uniref:anti-sigma factor family protein n=1 Tax=Cellulomonas sp. KRMCY2 TaxID=1304865 RepID=UPI00045EBE20|nr:zf-HC2 domain-containing protein [Cellulomonas sp. KRMCY2]